MAVNRIGSVAVLNNTMREVAGVQTKLGELQQQISSGIKADSFAGLNGQVEQYTQLNSQVRRTEQFKNSNQVAIAQMQTADQSMSELVDIADSMENLIVSARNPATGGVIHFEQQMRNYLAAMASELNATYQGHYLFGGTNTSVPPVPDTTIPPATTGAPDDIYYAGSKDNIVLRADEHDTYNFPVRADDISFQKIYAAAHQALEAFANNKDDAGLAQAVSLMQDGQGDLNALRSQLNNSVVNTTAINDRLDSMSKYWKGLTEEVSKTDLVSASTQVSGYEAILQATFQVYARLSQLRLSDYLK